MHSITLEEKKGLIPSPNVRGREKESRRGKGDSRRGKEKTNSTTECPSMSSWYTMVIHTEECATSSGMARKEEVRLGAQLLTVVHSSCT